MPSGSETPDRAGHFFRVPLDVAADPKLSTAAKLLYGALAYHAGQYGPCDPSQETLARAVGRSVRQVRRYVAELRAAGYISWTRRGFTKTNMYHPIGGPGAADA